MSEELPVKKGLPSIYVTGPVGAVVYLADQLTKFWIHVDFPEGRYKEILPFFSLNHVENTGAAFGMGVGQNFFFIIISIVVLGLLYWSSRRLPATGMCLMGQGLIWGGALGNLTDRFVSGHVTDFLDFYIGSHHWPSFNVADSAITVGAAILFLCTFF